MKAVVLDDYQRCAAGFADWDSLAAEVDFVHEHLTGATLAEALKGAEVVVAMRERTVFDAAQLRQLGALRLLVTTGAVNASIDVAAAHAQGITVCGTRSLASPAAELTWALILAVTRQVPESDAGLRSGGWQTTIGTELAGKTLGLVGLGRLGQRVARVGLAFEMSVLAWSQNLDPDTARGLGVAPTRSVRDVASAVAPSASVSRTRARSRRFVRTWNVAVDRASSFAFCTGHQPKRSGR